MQEQRTPYVQIICDACRDGCESVRSTLLLYRQCADAIGPTALQQMPAAGKEKALRKEMMRLGRLHPAMMTPDGNHKVCK